MKTTNKIKFPIFPIIYWILATLLAIYFLLPFFVLLTRSLMSIDEISQVPTPLFPGEWRFDNFIYPFTMQLDEGVTIFNALTNSVLVMGAKTLGVTVSSFICSFALSRIKFRGRQILFSCAMVTVMLPGVVTMIPLFMLYRSLNMLNTLLPLWLPACFGGGMMVIFLEMQFVKSISTTIDEAATIDGANYLQIAFYIILPLVKPVLVYVAVTTAIGSWNDFMAPLTYISTAHTEMYTLPLAFFAKFKNAVSIEKQMPHIKASLSLIMMLPIFILFAFFHKQMIHGISMGASIKG
ncbi:MAG: carbohydrate ABC transporter permease [Clostridia bacterium]|nr:carbohydrate ABC transporter permease [Clostridia bacterium]